MGRGWWTLARDTRYWPCAHTITRPLSTCFPRPQGNLEAPSEGGVPSTQRLLQLGLVGYALRSAWLPFVKQLLGQGGKVLSELRGLKSPSKLHSSKLA